MTEKFNKIINKQTCSICGGKFDENNHPVLLGVREPKNKRYKGRDKTEEILLVHQEHCFDVVLYEGQIENKRNSGKYQILFEVGIKNDMHSLAILSDLYNDNNFYNEIIEELIPQVKDILRDFHILYNEKENK